MQKKVSIFFWPNLFFRRRWIIILQCHYDEPSCSTHSLPAPEHLFFHCVLHINISIAKLKSLWKEVVNLLSNSNLLLSSATWPIVRNFLMYRSPSSKYPKIFTVIASRLRTFFQIVARQAWIDHAAQLEYLIVDQDLIHFVSCQKLWFIYFFSLSV